MKLLFFLVLGLLSCSQAPTRNISQATQFEASPIPFQISSGIAFNYSYKGTAYTIGDHVIVVEERWVNAVKLPFESHLHVSVIKGDRRISGPTQLFQNSKKYFYNPTFVK